MKNYTMLVLLLTGLYAHAQYTAIPDIYFENALILEGYDDVEDGQVLTSNINTITEIDLWDYYISDLTGIQDFVSLNYLYCEDNLLTSIDVSALTNLFALDCSGNQLTSITANTSIYSIICMDNNLTEIDFSPYPNLEQVWIDFNQLTMLDLSTNTHLNELYCGDNPLNFLNIQNSNNDNMLEFDATNVSSNLCIQVDDAALASSASIAPYNAWVVDASTQFSNDCCTVAIDDVLFQEISIYPSLVTDIFEIKNLETTSLSKILVYDSLGKVVLMTNKRIIDIAGLVSGMYLVKIITKDGRLANRKLIKL